MFSLSDCKFPLCQFPWFMTITYTKLTLWTYPASKYFGGIFAANIEMSFTFRIREFTTWANKISCVFCDFWQHFQIPCVFPDRDFLKTISCFPCAVGTLRHVVRINECHRYPSSSRPWTLVFLTSSQVFVVLLIPFFDFRNLSEKKPDVKINKANKLVAYIFV